MLEAIRQVDTRSSFYQASSSEMYGKVREVPQTELTPFYPRSPYGVSKVFAHYITVNYRESYDMFAVSGILFNHESPRRGLEFVTRKVTDGVARIKLGLPTPAARQSRREPRLGIRRRLRPRDVADAAAGRSRTTTSSPRASRHSVQRTRRDRVRPRRPRLAEVRALDPAFLRPAEVDHLIGDASKAKRVLGWEPSVSFERLVAMMVDADIATLSVSSAAAATTWTPR